jgi:hypothetical protein
LIKQEEDMETKWFKIFVLGLILALAWPAEANRRTYPVPDYLADPSANIGFVIEGDFEHEVDYSDPDFNLALQLPSPLDDRRFDSYNLIVVVNKSNLPGEPGQTMRVYHREHGLVYFWRVSTARAGKHTPEGYFRIEGFSSRHQSSLYNNAPMPFAVFFNGHIATHGTTGDNIAKLGNPASAGCVRLETQRAGELFHMIGNSGVGSVDQIGPFGLPIVDANGKVVKAWGYKTLIIIKSKAEF